MRAVLLFAALTVVPGALSAVLYRGDKSLTHPQPLQGGGCWEWEWGVRVEVEGVSQAQSTPKKRASNFS